MIDVKLDEDGIISVTIEGKEADIEYLDDESVFVECTLNDLDGMLFEHIPANLIFRVQESNGFDTYFFHEVEIKRDGLTFLHNLSNKYWEGKWGLGTFLRAIKQQVDFEEGITVCDHDFEDDYKRLNLFFSSEPSYEIQNYVNYSANRLKDLINNAEISLSGITWKREYETNELLFCLEILLPLLRRMGFISVRFSHGQKEYGKDFTFSELSPFGDLRHYGLQAKAGRISGEVNSDIDEIIGQIEDAFQMPYYELGSRDPRYISVFIVAISGRFTENAREKMANKVPKGLLGSIYFLDKDKIAELIERFWLVK